jgi:hypothetical protein
MQDMNVSNSQFNPLLREKLMKNLIGHVAEEEVHSNFSLCFVISDVPNDDLPSLEKAIDSTNSESKAKSFARTKISVPTQSHPNAPAKPLFETVAGMLAAPIDYLNDIFKKFPEDYKKGVPPP